jgi:aspartokinase
MSPAWDVVASFGTVLEAEFAAATLQEAGIPARVHGAHLGIWGAGYQGPSMFGARVMVPQHRADDARTLLEDLFAPGEDES